MLGTDVGQNIETVKSAGTFLSAEWRYLAMLNFEIDPACLLSYVPGGTELDAWNGKTFVSVVGFLFLKTQVMGWSIPFHSNFEEVNLRFYVRRLGPEGWRRGVVFIKEIVPKMAIASVARLAYNENYIALPMRHEVSSNFAPPSLVVEYGWKYRDKWNLLQVNTRGDLQPITLGSEEEFITEHYWGYAAQRDGSCVEYQVEHPSWRVWQVSDCVLDCNVAGLYGETFLESLQAAPSSAFLAEGSPVVVRKGIKL
ncbi:MAG: DUF2071 domain-containing protein [Chloroflexi bacterium]|nr:DUF2071 domain-containing protein [Chloroflexota bacterium]